MVKSMDCGIVECDFETQSPYYAYLRTNTAGKGNKLLILPAVVIYKAFCLDVAQGHMKEAPNLSSQLW